MRNLDSALISHVDNVMNYLTGEVSLKKNFYVTFVFEILESLKKTLNLV